MPFIGNTPRAHLHTTKRGGTHPATLPLFLPLPANPPPSSTPAHIPGFPSISPKYRRTPSNPSDSIRTLSPTSNPRPARLALRAKTSDVLLGGRVDGVFADGVLPALIAEEEDADEDGRTPALSDRGPLNTEEVELDGESWEDAMETSLVRGPRCCAGSFARIAS